jgi:hypothetical protein
MSDIAAILGIVVGASGLLLGYISSRRARALIDVVQDFATVAQVYYQYRPDGWEAIEKAKLADTTIAFFNAVEAAGIEIVRPK